MNKTLKGITCLIFKKKHCVFLLHREEQSLFQPGAEVLTGNHSSILDTVHDLVHNETAASLNDDLDFKGLGPQNEDPLNVMEPRPSKNLSEESLVMSPFVSKPLGDLYEMVLETNKRLDLLEKQMSQIMAIFKPVSALAKILDTYKKLVLKVYFYSKPHGFIHRYL